MVMHTKTPTPKTPEKIQAIPENTTFLWRKGAWRFQCDGAGQIKRSSPALSAALDSLKISGFLLEVTPGLFRLSATTARPLIDDEESPLNRLAQLKNLDGSPYLDGEQVRAGERLRRDHDRAMLSARVTTSYESSGSSGGRLPQFSDNHIEKLTENALTAREHVHRALQSVGPELSGILMHVCCMASGLEQAELQLNLPRRAGKAVLQLALTRLARHYGFKTTLHHAGPQRIGHWAVEGFRPVVSVPAVRQT
jgi:Domain of unknown function (DUF6456)